MKSLIHKETRIVDANIFVDAQNQIPWVKIQREIYIFGFRVSANIRMLLITKEFQAIR
jgi:hypothetical protein